MNHRTRVDWNFLWAAMYQACLPNVATHRLKFVLKDPIRHIPGPGNTISDHNPTHFKNIHNIPFIIPKLPHHFYTMIIKNLIIIPFVFLK